MTNQTPSLRIGLLDNSYHSLKRGYEMWSQWKLTDDAWLLKESIIWVHHGIELALKQLLAQTNAFLVFEDVNKAVQSLGNLRERKGMEKAGVLDLFDNDDKVMSVGFKNLIERAAVTLSIPELTKNEPLRQKIDELTKYRNKVVHFSIELDIAAVSNLLSEILDPLLFMLDREVADENFKNNRIPEIRTIAQPVKKYSEQIRSEILDNAIKATMQALPPTGNRQAGIVWQTLGSGLGSSLVSYLKLARLLPKIQDNHIIILVDRADLATQIYYLISNLDSEYSLGIIYCPESKPALVEILESNEPKIIVSTIQKFDPNTFTFHQDCLLVGYNLHGIANRLPEIFPKATFILFTNILLKPNSGLFQIFGDIVGIYDLKQAISDGVAKPVTIEKRKIAVRGDYSVDISEYLQSDLRIPLGAPKMTNEFVRHLAADIVEHFETRQSKWTSKGIVVIPDRYTGIALSETIANIRPEWRGDTEFTGSVKTISAIESPTQRAILVDRFRKENDALFLLLATGSFLQGYDNPLIHTIYVTNPVSLQLCYTLASLVSRPYKGKKDGLIVDYVGLDWGLDDLL